MKSKEKSGGNPIYLKFDYPEALESKRDILYSQKSLGSMDEAMKEYFLLKDKEVKIKIKLRRKIRELIVCIDNFQKIAPKVERPELLKKEEKQEKNLISTVKKDNKKMSKPVYEDSIESQLREIQDKLDRIGKS